METNNERLRRLAQQRRAATYHGWASGDLDDLAGGRYGVLRKPTVIGATASASYPQQPSGSPWARDECPPEPFIDGTGDGLRLGYAIDALDGTPPSSKVVEAEPPFEAATGDVRRPAIRLRRRI